jgi:hypothetical protein
MKRFEILFEAGITGPKKVAEASLDLVMEYLVDKGVEDPWIGLGPDRVEITVATHAENAESALAESTQLILDAIRAAGAKSPPPGSGGSRIRAAQGRVSSCVNPLCAASSGHQVKLLSSNRESGLSDRAYTLVDMGAPETRGGWPGFRADDCRPMGVPRRTLCTQGSRPH